MSIRAVVLTAICTLIAGEALAKQAYVCAEEGSSGFVQDKGKRRSVNFNEDKFTAVLDDSLNLETKTNERVEKYVCTNPLKKEFISCTSALGFYHFSLNMKNLKFVKSQTFPSENDSYSIGHGFCQLF